MSRASLIKTSACDQRQLAPMTQRQQAVKFTWHGLMMIHNHAEKLPPFQESVHAANHSKAQQLIYNLDR